MHTVRWTSIGLGLTLLLAAGVGTTVRAEDITWNAYAGGSWCAAGNWYPEDVPDESNEDAFLYGADAYSVYLDCAVFPRGITIANPNATLRFANGYFCVGDHNFINHGTLVTAVLAGMLGPVINEPDGRIRIEPDGIIRFGRGPVQNHGLILVNTAGLGTASLESDNTNASLGGSGHLLLHASGDPANAVLGSYGGGLLTHEAGHTIHGAGLVSTPLDNQGRVAADVADGLLRVTDARANTGTMEAVNAAILEVGGWCSQQAPGLIRADGATVRILSGARISGGSLAAINAGVIEVPAGAAAICEARLEGELRVLAGGRLIAGYDNLTNDGTIVLDPQGLSDDAVLQSWQYHNVTLTGSGQVVLRAGADVADARLETTGETIINGPLHTVRGDGAITCALTNQGLLSADAAGEVLRVSGHTTANTGTLEATGGGILELTGTFVPQQTLGTVRADGATVRIMNTARIEGGLIVTVNGGRIEASAGTSAICEATLNGTLDVLGGARLLAGYSTLTNNGTIHLNPGQSPDDAVLGCWQYQTTTLAGTGELVLATAGDPLDARLETTGETMVNGPLHTLRGEGAITCPFINDGLISADAPERTLQGTAPLTNHGTVEARNGGTARCTSIGPNYWDGGLHGGAWNVHAQSALRLPGAPIHTLDASMLLDGPGSSVYCDEGTADGLAGLSRVAPAGRLEVRSGRTLSLGGGLRNEGTCLIGLGGALSVADDLTNAGTLQPGRPAGRAAVGGDFTQDASGSLVIELAGLTPDLRDRVTAAGAAHLGGTLVVRAIGGFTPPDGAVFEIVTGAARLGEFDQVVCELPAGQTAQVVYDETSAIVVVSASSGVEEPELPGPGMQPQTGTAPRLSARPAPGGEAFLALELPEDSVVSVRVHDIAGRLVAAPADAAGLGAGLHTWRWDGRDLGGRRVASGVYLVRAEVRGAGAGARAPQGLRATVALVR